MSVDDKMWNSSTFFSFSFYSSLKKIRNKRAQYKNTPVDTGNYKQGNAHGS